MVGEHKYSLREKKYLGFVRDKKDNEKDNDSQKVLFGILFILAGSIVAILALIGGISITGIIIAIILIAIGYYIIASGKQTKDTSISP